LYKYSNTYRLRTTMQSHHASHKATLLLLVNQQSPVYLLLLADTDASDVDTLVRAQRVCT